MPAYFISDVHLGLGPREQERKKEDALLAFLEHIRPATSHLCIVGDLFDFWFDYRTVIPRGFHRTLAAIDAFTAQGTPVEYVVGNHDCWVDDFFETELKVTVHRNPVEIAIEGKRVYLHHGDGLADNDLGYRIIKPILRNRFNIALYRWIHPDIGVRLAQRSSRTSRGYTAEKHYGEGSGLHRFAAAKIGEGVDLVVMGHRHIPSLDVIGSGVYVNLGDWVHHSTYAVLEDGRTSLNIWNNEHPHGR